MGQKNITVSVNISVNQLEQVEFPTTVIKILNNNNVNASRIELEITESVYSKDTRTITKNLKELKSFGIKISMDDFGTGFSSLGLFDFFELDKLKIDKFFIDDIAKLSKKQKFVESIISLAKSLNITVVAEGIETQEQLSYLQDLDCNLGQGYLISKPLPVEEVEVFLR